MKDSFVQQCLDIMKKDEVKNEIKLLFKPVTTFIFDQLNPYIYGCIIVIFLILIINLAIFIILISLIRNKQNTQKFFNSL
jgi:hypothetical protein